ncbi:MAG: hypothetical protein N2652_06360 [Kiritimatiellae bacterium]|nr:hypothetical protein [Kiritimatiellia bacterium]
MKFFTPFSFGMLVVAVLFPRTTPCATAGGQGPSPWALTNAVTTAWEMSAVRFGDAAGPALTLGEFSAALARRSSEEFEVALTLRYSRLEPDGNADTPHWGAWRPVNELSVGMPLTVGWTAGRARIIPSVRWAAEEGTDWADASTIGVVAMHAWPLKAGHEVGVGALVSRGLGRTRVIPFPLFWWQLGDRWQLGNSMPLGPATPAGLELRWRADRRWTLGAGCSYRNDRYLRHSEEQVAEWRAVPIWLRGSYRFGPLGVTLWTGVAVARRIELRDADDGRRLRSLEPTSAPLVGLSLTARL